MFQIIQGGTIRGGDLLVTNVGYHYTRKADTRSGRSQRWYTNRSRGCKATITNSGELLIQDYNNIFVKHNHVSNINDTIVINTT